MRHALLFVGCLAAVSWRGSRALQKPPLQDFASDAPRTAYATFFEGCHAEGCGCGIPPGMAFVAGHMHLVPVRSSSDQQIGLSVYRLYLFLQSLRRRCRLRQIHTGTHTHCSDRAQHPPQRHTAV